MTSFQGTINFSSRTGTNGFKLNGVAVGDWAGFSVASAGDVNGDGFADLIVGTPNADPRSVSTSATSSSSPKPSRRASTSRRRRACSMPRPT
jgi:hypothetical protein